jgi:hypothetical protein
MIEVVIAFLLNLLFKEDWQFVVRDRELIKLFDGNSRFNPSRLSKSPSGDVQIKMDGKDGVCDPRLVETSEKCFHYIFQLMSFVHQSEMTIQEFFTKKNDWRRREIIDGILFEYFLLLITRYFELIAAEESEYQDLLDLSEDDDEIFEEKKKFGQILLGLLKLTSTDFPHNAGIMPKLHTLIDSFMHQFPDAMCLVVLADFSERGFESLYLDEESSFTGMCSCMNHESFRNERIFQNLDAFKDFLLSSYFTPERLSSTFILLLKTYCGEYSTQELRTAILNVTAFIMQKLPNEVALGIINQILIELEMQDETFQFILEAILVIEKENLGKLLEAPQFPIDAEESLKRLSDYLGGDFAEKHKYYCKDVQTKYPRDKLKIFLKEISEKSFIAGIIFARLFNKSYIERGRKLTDAFDAVVSGKIQSVIEHSKILRDCKEAPVELQRQLWFLNGRFPERILNSSGCGNKTTISGALEHLRISRQKIHEARQAEWRDGGVALQLWESRSDKDDSEFPRYQKLTEELMLIDSLISELKKYSGLMLLKDVRDENKKDIERVNAQIKVFDDQKHRIMQEYQRLRKEAKKSILDRLFGA